LAAALDEHSGDAWGLGLIALGLVLGLAIYLDMAGPLGRALDLGVGAALGMVRLVVPVGLVAAGVALVREHRDDEPSGGPNVGHPARLIVGSALLLVSVTGLLHLGRGTPALADGLRPLGRAGGVTGYVFGAPLDALASTWASALVLLAVGLVGLVVLTKTSVRTAADRTAAGVRPLGRLFTSLFELTRSDASPSAPITGLYDQDADSAGADADVDLDLRDRTPAPKRAPKPKVNVPDPFEDEGPGEQLAIDLGPGAKASP